MMTHAFNSRTWKAEADRSLRVCDSEFLANQDYIMRSRPKIKIKYVCL